MNGSTPQVSRVQKVAVLAIVLASITVFTVVSIVYHPDASEEHLVCSICYVCRFLHGYRCRRRL